MFQYQWSPYELHIREACGLGFDPQLVYIEIPAGMPPFFWLRDTIAGQLYPVQSSGAGAGLLHIEIAPFQELRLVPAPGENGPELPELAAGSHWLANGNLSLELPPDREGPIDAHQVSGPIAAIGLKGHKPRGKSHFDTRSRILRAQGKWWSQGPLRAMWTYTVTFEDGGEYEATVYLAAGETYAEIIEEFRAESGAQLVWDFSGEDWPEELFLLDPTPGGTFRQLHAHFDARHARLAAWTQYQQLHDLSDGFALLYEEDLLGMVTLHGGTWGNNRLNHIEAWTRRFRRNAPRTRRAEPWDSKADSMPGPEQISERGKSLSTAHFCLESWIGNEGGSRGWRRFALVAAPRDQLFPGAQNGRRGDGKSANVPARERYRREQSLLRRIHTQRGLLPLSALASTTFEGDMEAPPLRGIFQYPDPLLEPHLRHQTRDEAGRIEQLKEYLASFVYGFWEGGGAAHSNCVAGRSIAPQMFHFEALVHNGGLPEADIKLLRAQFIFLCQLFHSSNYYPGPATMTPNGHRQSFEPTIAGMANQNFFTDVLCVAGTGAQVFPNHPDAQDWRERFGTYWRRQLEFHRYPQSGVWEESHTYCLHVLHTVVPLLLRRRDDGHEKPGEGFQDSLFHSLCSSILGQITPRHDHNRGYRHILAWGDHEADRHDHFVPLLAELARALSPHQPQLAQQLAWVGIESGGQLVDGIQEEPVPWQSGALEGLGFCFRNYGDDGAESLLALRAGAAWGHHHHDDGSIQFFASGRALVVDAAFGNVSNEPMRKLLASGHSRWSLRDQEPFDYFWRFNRGWIAARETEGPFPYAVAWTPVYMVSHGVHTPHPLWPYIRHWRTVVQLAPEAFLIVDESDATIAQVVRFQLPGTASVEEHHVLSQNGPVQLHLVPLEGTAIVELGRRDVPKDPGKDRYITQEVIFHTGTAPRSVILMATGGAIEVVQSNGIWELSGAGWSAALALNEMGIQLTDSQGNKRVLGTDVLRADAG